MFHSRSSSVFALALLFTIVAVPESSTASLTADPILVQSTSSSDFPLPDPVPTGSTIRIDDSNSMAVINQALQQRFEQQDADTSVELEYSGTSAALQALRNGGIDLVAIGRPLIEEEKAQGFTDVSVGRPKIAILVGAENPFTGEITFDQFAKNFRGEITDWSEIGGEPGSIRMIDHPLDSDTRAAIANYPVFQAAPFESGANTVRVEEASADAIENELGTDGISYVIANQAFDRPGVKLIPLHGTLPNGPRYPYSQPLYYVYTEDPSPAVASFVGFTAAPVGQEVIATTGATTSVTTIAQAPDSPSEAVSPGSEEAAPVTSAPDAATPPADTPPDTAPVLETESAGEPEEQFPILGWLLLLLLLGIPLLWRLFKGSRRRTADTPPPPVTPPDSTPPTEPTLAERAETVISADRASMTDAPPPETTEASAPAEQPDEQPAIDPAIDPAIAGAAAAAAAGIATNIPGDTPPRPSRIVLTPRNAAQAYAYWEVPEENKTAMRQQGGRQYALRLYDVTDIAPDQQSPRSMQQFTFEETRQELYIPIPQSNRDYIAEIGYLTQDNQWLRLARSTSVRIPAPPPTTIQSETTIQAAPEPPTPPNTPNPLTSKAAGMAADSIAMGGSHQKPNHITLTPRSAEQVYAAWDVPAENQAAMRQQGGKYYILRIYDVTGINPEQQLPHSMQQFACMETDRDLLVPIPQSDRDYLAEIGYLTDDNRWLSLARSTPVRVPAPEAREVAEERPAVDQTTTIAGATLAGGIAASQEPGGDQETVEAAKFNVGQTDLRSETLADVDVKLPDLPSGYGESRIVLMPLDPNWAYTYWDVPNEHKETVRRQGGSRLALRFYDVTGINLDFQKPHSLQQYDCDELARDWYLPVPMSDRDYIVEIGYLTNDGWWLLLARSLAVRIPPVYPSDWLDEQFVTIDWQEDLRGKQFLDLGMPGSRPTYKNPLYDKIFDIVRSAESQRVAGSLFGSMQHVPPESISSHIFPSGIAAVPTASGVGMMSGAGITGMSGASVTSMSGVGMPGIGMMGIPTASGMGMMSGVGITGMSGLSMSGIGMSGVGMMGIPTLSGIGMSGVGMGLTLSGVGMSGVGFAASMPAIRPRKFWLVANAELIVHGATEPDATVLVGDRPIKLNPDGTFRFQIAFPDGDISYPILAIAADGEQNRSIQMEFNRETPSRHTNTREEAVDEWRLGEG